MLNLFIEATACVKGMQGLIGSASWKHEVREWLSCDVLCLASDKHLVTRFSRRLQGLVIPHLLPTHTIVERLELSTCSTGWVNNLFWLVLGQTGPLLMWLRISLH